MTGSKITCVGPFRKDYRVKIVLTGLRFSRDRKEDPGEGACPKRRASPDSCAFRYQKSNRGSGCGGGLDYGGGLIREALRLGQAPSRPRLRVVPVSCRASAGSASALPGGRPFPADSPLRKRVGTTIHGGPRDRKEDPWEGACPKRRAFPDSCAFRYQKSNRGPGSDGGLDYGGGLIRAARRLGQAPSRTRLRRAHAKKFERLRGGTSRVSAKGSAGGTSSRFRLERRWRDDLRVVRGGSGGASSLVGVSASPAGSTGRDRSGPTGVRSGRGFEADRRNPERAGFSSRVAARRQAPALRAIFSRKMPGSGCRLARIMQLVAQSIVQD